MLRDLGDDDVYYWAISTTLVYERGEKVGFIEKTAVRHRRGG